VHLARLQDEAALMVPLRRGASPDLVTAEYIAADGTKDYAYALPTTGAFFAFGSLDASGPVFLCEGIATAWTVNSLTGHTAIRCGGADNIKQVAKDLRELRPTAQIVVCAERGNGYGQAAAAAAAVSGAICAPPFSDGDEGTDFNDFWQIYGDDATRAALSRTIEADPAQAVGTQDAAIREWFDEINKSYFVARWGEETTICRENEDGTFSPESDRSFSLALAPKRPSWSDRPPHALWKSSPHRREYNRVGYDPEWLSLDKERDRNLWRGFSVEPRASHPRARAVLKAPMPAPAILNALRLAALALARTGSAARGGAQAASSAAQLAGAADALSFPCVLPGQSTAIASAVYEGTTNTLHVVFTDETEATYEDVPLTVARGLLMSTSKGGFFNAHIRNVYG
jgi:hypothetical protein